MSHMSHMSHRCGRCKFLERHRSFKKDNCCRECQNISDAEAEIRKARRMGEDIDIIGDGPTASHTGIDLLDRRFFLPSATNENSSYTIVAPTEGFGYVARNHGINISQVDFFGDRTTVLTTEIDALSGKNLTLILFPGRSQAPAVRRLLARAEAPVIVLADGDAAIDWENQAPGVLTISEDELPKRR